MIEKTDDAHSQTHGIAYLKHGETAGFITHNQPVHLAEHIGNTDIIVKGHDGKCGAEKTHQADKYGLGPLPDVSRRGRRLVGNDEIRLPHVVYINGGVQLFQLVDYVQGAYYIAALGIHLHGHDLHGIAFVHHILVVAVNLGNVLQDNVLVGQLRDLT